MKYKIYWFTCEKAQRGWIITVDVKFPTKRQFTWEQHTFENTQANLKPSHSIIWALIKFWLIVRKEIKQKQSLPGDFEIV